MTHVTQLTGIWLTAAHIPGKENVTADYESRNCSLDTEWIINPKYLSQALKGIPFTPVIDLFASRINKQFDQYMSYRPDSFASYIDIGIYYILARYNSVVYSEL